VLAISKVARVAIHETRRCDDAAQRARDPVIVTTSRSPEIGAPAQMKRAQDAYEMAQSKFG
jgi:hypothetical protein